MNININKLFPENRKDLIQSLELCDFLYEVSIKFGLNYRETNNESIRIFFKLISLWRDWEFKNIKEYRQLLYDHYYWKSRQYYYEKIEEFVSNKITIIDFINQVLYPILSDKDEANELLNDFQHQEKITLDPNSLGFSKIIISLIPVLEGYEDNIEETIFTEQEFREIIKKAFIQLKQYSIE